MQASESYKNWIWKRITAEEWIDFGDFFSCLFYPDYKVGRVRNKKKIGHVYNCEIVYPVEQKIFKEFKAEISFTALAIVTEFLYYYVILK